MTAPRLLIEYTTTTDMPDGRSLPPFVEDDGTIWRAVRRLPGERTRWCRIRLSSDCATSGRLIAQHSTEWRQIAQQEESDMDIRKFVGQNFIKIADVRDAPLRMQIAAINEGKYEKPDVVFETGETLSLNTINARTLMRAYGPESDSWIGKEIELALGTIEFQNRPQEAVVVKPISPPAASRMDDTIPF
jgi:hypothetical protein